MRSIFEMTRKNETHSSDTGRPVIGSRLLATVAILSGSLFMALGTPHSASAQIVKLSGEPCPLPLISPEVMNVEVTEFELFGLLDENTVLVRYTMPEDISASLARSGVNSFLAGVEGVFANLGGNAAAPEEALEDGGEEDHLIRQFGLAPRNEFEALLPMVDWSGLPDGSTLQNVNQGMNGEAARSIQQSLIKLGYLTGTADAAYGNGTAAAVRAFQADNYLEATGNCDVITQMVLLAADNGTLTEEVTYPYPPVFTAEDKFAAIYKYTFDDLSAFLGKEWKFSYDRFYGKGSISQNLYVGSASVQSPAIDRISLKADLHVLVTFDQEKEGIVLTPTIHVTSTGAYLPYVQSAILSADGAVLELTGGTSSGNLEGVSMVEDANVPLTEKALDFILNADNLIIRLEGSYNHYDLEPEFDEDMLASFAEAVRPLFQ